MDTLQVRSLELPGLEVRIANRCPSTNDVLFRSAVAPGPVLLAAEHQTLGRGRRGRRWYSAPGAGITFSLAAAVARPAREIAALSLVAGVAAARALRALGVAETALKWPNDLVVRDAKLGGILVETRSLGERTLAVIGIGINCRVTPGLERRLGRRIAYLEQLLESVDRNRVIREIARALLEALAQFERGGLAPLRAEWERLDAHAGRTLRVRLADGRMVTGVSSGLAPDGGLRLATRHGMRSVTSGRVVSARATPAPRAGLA